MTSRNSPFLSIGNNLSKQRIVNPYATIEDGNVTKKRYLIEDLPLKIGGCSLWLDSADISTLLFNNNKISQWDDKSGNGYHLTQSTEVNQPTYNSIGLNSKPTLFFGGNQYLERKNTFQDFDSCDVFIVFEIISTDESEGMFDISNGIATNSGFEMFYTPSKVGTRVYDGANKDAVYNVGLPLPASIFECAFDEVNVYLYSNDDLKDTTPAGPFANILNTLTVGRLFDLANFSLIGNISELIIYNKFLNTNERNLMNNYLSFKWGISI